MGCGHFMVEGFDYFNGLLCKRDLPSIVYTL